MLSYICSTVIQWATSASLWTLLLSMALFPERGSKLQHMFWNSCWVPFPILSQAFSSWLGTRAVCHGTCKLGCTHQSSPWLPCYVSDTARSCPMPDGSVASLRAAFGFHIQCCCVDGHSDDSVLSDSAPALLLLPCCSGPWLWVMRIHARKCCYFHSANKELEL